MWACMSSICPSVFKLIHIFIFFSRTTGPFGFSSKLYTKHPWVKGILGYSNEWPRSFLMGDNYEIANIWKFTSPESLGKFRPNNPWVKETQCFANNDHIKEEIIIFFSPDQHYYIIIALRKCVYWFELGSQMSDVAHGPLVLYVLIWKQHHMVGKGSKFRHDILV